MNNEMLEKAEQAMKFLADKMGVATAAFWPTFIRKQILDAIVVFVWLMILLPIAVYFAPICFAWPESEGLSDYDIDMVRWIMRAVGVVLCLSALNAVDNAIDLIKYLGNLKYWALKDFLSTLGNLVRLKDE